MTPLFYEDSLGAKAVETLDGLGSTDDDLVDDPEALEAAQRAANGMDPDAVYAQFGPDWVAVFGPTRLSGFMSAAGGTAFQVTSALDTCGIPYAWDPYPPSQMPAFRPFYGAVDRPFTLFVAPDRAAEAREALAGFAPRPARRADPNAALAPESAARHRRLVGWLLFTLALGLPILALLVSEFFALFPEWFR